jgi:hypothetical protein
VSKWKSGRVISIADCKLKNANCKFVPSEMRIEVVPLLVENRKIGGLTPAVLLKFSNEAEAVNSDLSTASCGFILISPNIRSKNGVLSSYRI